MLVIAKLTVTITSFSVSTIASSTDNIGTQTATVTATDVTTVTSTVTEGNTQSETLVLRSDSGGSAAAKRRRSATLVKRQQRVIPAFATAECPEASAFSSACNCIGITPGGTLYIHVNGTTTSTIPRTTSTTVPEVHEATTTVTSTARTLTTSTVFTTVAPTVTAWIFRIGVAEDDPVTNYRGQFWTTVTEDASPFTTRLAYIPASSSDAAPVFIADPDGNIRGGGQNKIFAAASGEVSEPFYLLEDVGSLTEVPCKFDINTFDVTCSSPSQQNWVGANKANSRAVIFNTGNSGDFSSCCTGPFSMKAVPIFD
ncbi:hypothetical protein TWF696_005584 [Orbilia brochopaga]|uniref:Uncharacterized protein n=1 Tax=Orbilia brochopaga TaxID=3140254 RepID=A0AAV9V181_9PEZI